MVSLSLNLLGTVQVTLDGESITAFESDKVRALLAYLVVESDRPHRRETLAGLLWPDMAERDARTNLRQALANLRKILGDRGSENPFLLINRQTIQFNITSDYQLDVKVFTDAITATTGHTHGNLEDCEECMMCLSEAEQLYKGEFLTGFSLPSNLFEEWMVVQREKLHIQVLDVLEHLASHHEKKGDYITAQRYAQRQVKLESWRESAHRQLMRAYALSGQRGMALAQYESCQRILETELGIEPELETTALYDQIRRGKLQQVTQERITKPIPEPAATNVVPHNLPTSLTPFVGREELLSEITALVCNPDCRLLTLVGPGGSGKTRLALEVARKLMLDDDRESIIDGLFFTSLAAVMDVESLVPAVGQALGFTFYGEGEPKDQLFGYLRGKRLLLILDNFEHLVENAGLIDEMLRTAPGIKVLVTSRVKLNLRPEQRIPVPGMEYPTSTSDLDAVSRYSAIKLFGQCTRRVQPDFILDAGNAAGVVRLCQQVHGMPLGILMTTAWMHILTPGEISDEIDRSLDFLEMEWQEVPIRQRSMRAVFDHSWRLLTVREREILCGLSVFRGGCTREAAQYVTGATLRDLLGLISKSQLHRTPTGRYEMHELLRQYATELLAQQPENLQWIRERHCVYYAENLIRWEGELKGSLQHQATEDITSDQENNLSAIDWMLENAKVIWLEHAVDALGIFFQLVNRYQEGAVLCQMIAEKTKAFTSENGLMFRAQVLAWQSYFAEQSGNSVLARQIINESLSIVGLSDVINSEFYEPAVRIPEQNQSIRAFVYWAAGNCHYDKDIAKTIWLFEQSLALNRRLGNQWAVAHSLSQLAFAMNEAGKYEVDEVEQLIRESLAIAQTIGDYKSVIASYQLLSGFLISRGRVEEGESYFDLTATTAEKTGVAMSIFASIWQLKVTLRLGKFTQALSHLKAEIARYENQKVGKRLIEGKLFLSDCYRNLGFYEVAYAIALECLEYCIKEGYKRRGSDSCLQLGMNSIALGRYAEAQTWLVRSASQYREFDMNEKCEILFGLGYAAHSLGYSPEAIVQFQRAIQLAVRQHDWETMHHLLPGVALMVADLGQHERAVELYALASKNPYVANSKWFEDVAGKRIAKVAESLPPEIVAATQKRGRELNLWETAEDLLVELGVVQGQ